MRYFDLHCDTLYRMIHEKQPLEDNDFHISLKKIRGIDTWFQFMAVWIPDDFDSKNGMALLKKGAEKLEKYRQNSSNNITVIDSFKGVEKPFVCTCEKSDIAGMSSNLILSVENGRCIGRDLSNLDVLHELGVKMITLTWNGVNEIGTGANSTGTKEDSGITEFGREAVKRMEELSIAIDVSHASDKLFEDVCQEVKRPFVASHSNSRKICNHKRNLTDEQFLKIKAVGGLVGLNFCRAFLKNEENGVCKANMYDILRHAEHFLSLGGENVLSIGSDFDGTDMPDGLESIANIQQLYELFLRHNYKEKLVNKIFFDNAYEFFTSFDNGRVLR